MVFNKTSRTNIVRPVNREREGVVDSIIQALLPHCSSSSRHVALIIIIFFYWHKITWYYCQNNKIQMACLTGMASNLVTFESSP